MTYNEVIPLMAITTIGLRFVKYNSGRFKIAVTSPVAKLIILIPTRTVSDRKRKN
jgi:hypothetical protein